ncbi:MAG: PucR family transcriptional regulator, partial [Pseudomonadota bacterium]
MTTVITRYFEDAAQCRAVQSELLYSRGFPARIVTVFDSPDGLVGALTAAEVKAATADTYQAKMAKGGAVLLVRAGYRPLGAAKTTRLLAASMGGAALDNVVEQVVVKDKLEPIPKVLAGGPR